MSVPSDTQVDPVIAAARPVGVLVCRARAQLCAISLEQVIETMRPLPVGRISATIPFVTGVAIIRGAAVPVVDLGKVLGSDDSENPTRFITLRIDERTVALSVEEIVGIRTLATASMQRLPPLLTDVDGQLISSLGTLDAALLLVLRAARLLPDAEWTALLDDGGLS